MILDRIKKENDIKQIDETEYTQLAEEIRNFLIDKISVNGGHLASNLGVVELTMALHLVFNLPQDRMIWDVGHQSYTHKILTGRKGDFDELRKYGGMSGFPKRKESRCDAFDTGHSSTSISAGLGYAQARDILKEDYSVISIIGDGSLTGGMAYEALNNAARLKSNFIIILNDNNMSISENVGGVSKYLSNIRTGENYNEMKEEVASTLSKIPVYGDKIVDKISKAKSGIKQLVIPGMLFENLGVTYLGPVDGHNIAQMIKVFNEAKKLNRAVVIHVRTKKGKGYKYAEKSPSKFHAIQPFDRDNGQVKKEKIKPNYTDVFSKAILKLSEDNKKIVAVTAAMADGTGLKRFSQEHPDRFFDVGIAEEHAVTFAAGMAAAGLKPFVAVYSSFLQRAYDQIIHDVCIQNLPVVFAIDRAGLVGSDGETHQGIFDLTYMSSIPNMCVMAPKNKYELVDMVAFAAMYDGPISIRYPRGEAYDGLREYRAPIVSGKSEILYIERDIVLLAVGSMVKTAVEVREKLVYMGLNVSIINVRFVKPIDYSILDTLNDKHYLFVTLEENLLTGGYGEKVSKYICDMAPGNEVINIGIDDNYVEHGNVDILKKEEKLDAESVVDKIIAVLNRINIKNKEK